MAVGGRLQSGQGATVWAAVGATRSLPPLLPGETGEEQTKRRLR